MSRPDDHRPPPDRLDPRTAIPTPVRLAGWISSAQGLIGVGVAVALAIRAAGGHREETVVISGYGTAVWFAILGGGLLAAGVGLLRGSDQYLAGLILAVVCAVALVSLFRRDAIEWYAV